MPRTRDKATIPTGYGVLRVDTPSGRRYIAAQQNQHHPAEWVAIGSPKRSHFDAASLIYRDVARRVDAGELRIERTENAS